MKILNKIKVAFGIRQSQLKDEIIIKKFSDKCKSQTDYTGFKTRPFINLVIYNDRGENTYTLIFSKRLNPYKNFSFMNIHFMRFIQSFAGSMFWADDDRKKIIHLGAENEFGDHIALESFKRH